MTDSVFDLAIVGGGVNGTGVAADASGRNLKVFLCEQNDLASGTSSASSKLIHGGLRYLEHYEFRLVREALKEREILLKKAPHLVKPLKFTMPHRPHLRPAWLIRLGLFLYDHLSFRNSLPKARLVTDMSRLPFSKEITKGFEYYDCWVDDSRLVIANAKQAEQMGARIEVQTECKKLEYLADTGLWELTLYNRYRDTTYTIQSKHVVNASGPWLNHFQEQAAKQIKPGKTIRLIKGSHIIVPKVIDQDEAFILQNEDKRIVFVLPYQEHYSIIGTTDKEYKGDPANVAIDDDEINYLLKVFNNHFEKAITSSDIVSTYSGIRPLCDDESSDPSAITRDYTIDLQSFDQASLVSIYGGKITTYRKLAEAVMLKLSSFIPDMPGNWTASIPLPGNQHMGETLSDIHNSLLQEFPWLSRDLRWRYARSYGHSCTAFLTGKSSETDLGQNFGMGLYQAEVDYLIDTEWARTAEDILWRRTKLGLKLSEQQSAALDRYVTNRLDNSSDRCSSLAS